VVFWSFLWCTIAHYCNFSYGSVYPNI
jgi:hypothetical protein